MKRTIIAFVLCVTLLLSLPGGAVMHTLADEETYPRLEDTSKMSDEDFFGVWSDQSERWTTVGKLNYDYSEELADVERYVKLGSYDMAKEALLSYYKNRTGIANSKDYSGYPDELTISYIERDMLFFTEAMIAPVTISASDDYRRYEVNLENMSGGRVTIRLAQGAFMLQAADKSEDIVSILSKEGDPARAPKLLIYLKNGKTMELPVLQDSYTRAYEPGADYSGKVYGDQPELLVKDSAYQQDNGLWQPFGANTRQAYMNFSSASLPSTEDISVAKLVFYAKLIPEEGSSEVTAQSKEILVCDSANKAWRETPAVAGTTPVLSWNTIAHYSYSWNGLPGGIYWKDRPAGAASEFLNANTRFYELDAFMRKYMQSGDDKYVYEAMEMVNDFIRDAGAGTPAGREIEAANRAILLPPAYFHFIQSPYINADANAAMLKYLWEEATYLNSGAGYMFGVNRALWHDTGFCTILTYFPEFADSTVWRQTWEERIEQTLDALIADDGCYSEPTYGYPNSVVDWLLGIVQCFKDTGEEPPQALYDKAILLTRYLMYSSYPNGTPPNWGEGGPAATQTLAKKIGELLGEEELLYWGTRGSDNEDGKEPEALAMRFPYLKLVTSRTNWGPEASMIFINAKNGGSHGHRDSLALGFYADGRELLRDTGMTTYDGSHPHFDWQRHQTKSHNTVEIDGKAQRGDQSSLTINGDSDIQLYAGESIDRVAGWTEATQGFRHNRKVTFLKDLNFLIVSDLIEPSDTAEHFYRQNWHFLPIPAPNTTIDEVTKTGETHFEGGANIKVIQARPETLSATLADGYDVMGQSDTKYLQYERKQTGNTAFDTVLFPVAEGESAEINVDSLEMDADPAVASAMDISIFRNNEERRSVVYYNSNEETPSERDFGEYTTDASAVVMVRDADNVAQSISLYGGTALTQNGAALVHTDNALADLSISFGGSTASLISSDPLAEDTKIMLSTPYAINKVTLNGASVKTTIRGNAAYINYEGDEEEISQGEGLVYLLQVEVDGKPYDVKAEIPAGAYRADNVPPQPTVAYTDGKIQLSFAGGTLERAMRITVTGHTGAKAYVDKDGTDSVIPGVSTLSQEQADQTVAVGAPRCVSQRKDLEIWTKDLAVYKIVSPPKDDTLPSSGSNLGGGAKDLAGRGGGSGGVSIPSASPTPTPAEPTSTPPAAAAFEDTAGHWAEKDIAEMTALGIVNGIDETHFAPDANVTRAEFAALLVRTLGMEEAAYSGEFSDVSADDWYAGIAAAASRAGLVQGADGAFLPQETISREQMAVMIARACESRLPDEAPDTPAEYTDADEFAQWAASAIQKVTALGLMNGIDSTTFGPQEPATRAQAVAILHRFLVLENREEATQ